MGELPIWPAPKSRWTSLPRSLLRLSAAPDGRPADPAALAARARDGRGEKGCRCGPLRLLAAALAGAVGLYVFLAG
jgi:hypothetical protein